MGTPEHPIRAYRLNQSPPVTLEDLAKRIGTTKPNLSRIETGKQPLSEALMKKLIAETGLSAAALRPDLAKLFAPGTPKSRRAA